MPQVIWSCHGDIDRKWPAAFASYRATRTVDLDPANGQPTAIHSFIYFRCSAGNSKYVLHFSYFRSGRAFRSVVSLVPMGSLYIRCVYLFEFGSPRIDCGSNQRNADANSAHQKMVCGELDFDTMHTQITDTNFFFQSSIWFNVAGHLRSHLCRQT